MQDELRGVANRCIPCMEDEIDNEHRGAIRNCCLQLERSMGSLSRHELLVLYFIH